MKKQETSGKAETVREHLRRAGKRLANRGARHLAKESIQAVRPQAGEEPCP